MRSVDIESSFSYSTCNFNLSFIFCAVGWAAGRASNL